MAISLRRPSGKYGTTTRTPASASRMSRRIEPLQKIGSSIKKVRRERAERVKRCCGRWKTKSQRKCEKQTRSVDSLAFDTEGGRSLLIVVLRRLLRVSSPRAHDRAERAIHKTATYVNGRLSLRIRCSRPTNLGLGMSATLALNQYNKCSCCLLLNRP